MTASGTSGTQRDTIENVPLERSANVVLQRDGTGQHSNRVVLSVPLEPRRDADRRIGRVGRLGLPEVALPRLHGSWSSSRRTVGGAVTLNVKLNAAEWSLIARDRDRLGLDNSGLTRLALQVLHAGVGRVWSETQIGRGAPEPDALLELLISAVAEHVRPIKIEIEMAEAKASDPAVTAVRFAPLVEGAESSSGSLIIQAGNRTAALSGVVAV